MGHAYKREAETARGLTLDEARRIASNIAKKPLRCILLSHQRRLRAHPLDLRTCCSARSLDLLIYRDELMEIAAYDLFDISVTLTRQPAGSWRGYRRRVDGELLTETGWPAADRPLTYICGPTGFVETAADHLVALGHDPLRIRTERFGGTGVARASTPGD